MVTDLYKPFRKNGSIANEIDNLAHRSFGGPITTGPLIGEWLLPEAFKETKSEVTYTIELPGLKGEEIDISIDDDVMTIHLEKKRDSHSDNSSHQLGEKFYGSVKKTIKLPAEVMANYLDARFVEGVLTIKIPKMRKTIHKEVRVKTETDIRDRKKGSTAGQVDDDYGIIDLLGWSV